MATHVGWTTSLFLCISQVCISKSAVKTKFEQHTSRGKNITCELRSVMEQVYSTGNRLQWVCWSVCLCWCSVKVCVCVLVYVYAYMLLCWCTVLKCVCVYTCMWLCVCACIFVHVCMCRQCHHMYFSVHPFLRLVFMCSICVPVRVYVCARTHDYSKLCFL